MNTIGSRQDSFMATNPSYFEIIDFMFEKKSLEQIIEFHPSEAT